MSTLKGSVIPTPKLLWSPISQSLQDSTEFTNLQTYYPGMGIVSDLKQKPKEHPWFDHSHRIIKAGPAPAKHSTPLTIQIEKNSPQSGLEVEDISGFRKITHLLDPVSWLQGKYSVPKQTILPGHNESWGLMNAKLQDPMNQAYIEALANYCFSRLREGDYTPHFHRFFGAFCGVADTYAYNITDSYMTYRHRNWFWEGQSKKLFSLGFEDAISDEIRSAILEKPEDLYDSDEESSEEELDEVNKIKLDLTELKDLECDDVDESASLKSAHMSDMETVNNDDSSGDDADDEEDEEDKDDLNIFAEIKQFPVMMIYTEFSEGTMDDLLDDFEEVGARPGTPGWELRWKSWIFQVIAALSVAQTIFGFTHNDLHSNNIVWSKTDQEYMYYNSRDGLHFKIPTFGKLFRIIDFGRSIFRVNQTLFFSDDFRPGNDAAEQFNFGEIYDPNEEEVPPNPSFDLSRFTVSVFEAIFPSSPPLKPKGKILSQEDGLKMMETESELYNVMWSWLLCTNGENVLMEPDGKEKYPDFELYKIIAAEVHNAVPSQQIKKALFEEFRVKKKGIPDNAKIYSLFC